MSNQEDKIISILKAASKHKLSVHDRDQLKFSVMDAIREGKVATKSPLTNKFAMPLVPVLIATILTGASGTAVMANDAKPGDALFKVDQFVENLETKLVFDEEAKVKLMASLAQERVAELEAIGSIEDKSDKDTKFEEHKAEAIARVAVSVERLNLLEAKFQARLESETDTKAKARFEKIISHLHVIEGVREKQLDKIEAKVSNEGRGSINSGSGSVDSKSRAWLKVSDDDKAKIEKEVEKEFHFKKDKDEDRDRKTKKSTDDDNGNDAPDDSDGRVKSLFDDKSGRNSSGGRHSNDD